MHPRISSLNVLDWVCVGRLGVEMSTVDPLVLTIEERGELERRLRAQTTAHRDRQRAQVVLLAADGVAGRRIAAMVGLSQQSVCKWRIQFCDRGLDGLDDAPRSGRPLVYGPTDRLVLMAKVTGEHPRVDSQWSHSELAAEMAAAAIPISASQIGRILAADDVKPHRVQGWLTRRDSPEFWQRAADVWVSTWHPRRTRWCCRSTRRPGSRPSPANTPPKASSPAGRSGASSNTSATGPRR